MSGTITRITTDLEEEEVGIENKIPWKGLLERGMITTLLLLKASAFGLLCLFSFMLMGQGIWILGTIFLPIMKGLFFLWMGLALYVLILMVLLPWYLPEASLAMRPTVVAIFDYFGKFFYHYAVFFIKLKKEQVEEKKK